MGHALSSSDFIINHVRRVGRVLLPSRWVDVAVLKGGAVRLTVEYPSMASVLAMLTEVSALREMAREDLHCETEHTAAE